MPRRAMLADALAPGDRRARHRRPRHGRRAAPPARAARPTATSWSTACATSAANRGCCTSTPSRAPRDAVLAAMAGGRGGAIVGARRATRRSRRAVRRRSIAEVLPRIGDVLVAARGGHRLLRRPARRQGRPAHGRPARLAHRRGARSCRSSGWARSPDGQAQSSVRAPKTISSHDGIDVRPLRRPAPRRRRPARSRGSGSSRRRRGRLVVARLQRVEQRHGGVGARGGELLAPAAARAARGDAAAPRAGRRSRTR